MLGLAGCGEKEGEKVKVVVKEVPVERIVEVEKKPRVIYADLAEHDVRRTAKGFDLLTRVEEAEGGVASAEREREEAYFAEYRLKVTVPRAARTMGELEAAMPGLGKALPGLEAMAGKARVSGFYGKLYSNKLAHLKKNLPRLDALMTRHNFYDCQTILEMEHAGSGRKVLLVQAEMDVVSDGSDGDRLPVMPEGIVTSPHYQHSTSWWWPKRTDRPNPMIRGFRERIGKAEAELEKGGLTEERVRFLEGRIPDLRRCIEESERNSFLIAKHDPFIVMPVFMVTAGGNPYRTMAGDYAVVVHGGVLYPAIVGDAGPDRKMGEASLRMARQINPEASSYRRPVSELTVTYLVFPGSRGERKPPDYAEWRARCAELLGEMGGAGEGMELFEWKNTLPDLTEPESPAEDDGGSGESPE